MNETDVLMAIYSLCDFLSRYYGKKVIILLDEYDTPMQEAYVHGYWEELVSFTRSLLNLEEIRSHRDYNRYVIV